MEFNCLKGRATLKIYFFKGISNMETLATYLPVSGVLEIIICLIVVCCSTSPVLDSFNINYGFYVAITS